MTSEHFCINNNKKQTIIEDVDSTDYMYLVLASIISSCGFILDSETAVIGSMLISPLLKPVLNLVEALSHWNPSKHVIRQNFGHTAAMILITIVIGVITGWSLKFIDEKLWSNIKASLNKTNQELKETNKYDNINTIIGRRMLMHAPGQIYFYVGLIAFCGGFLLSRSKCKESTLTTVVIGTGISTSVLPPLIASGIWAGIGGFEGIPRYQTASFSSGILLGLGNIVLIFIGYYFGTHYHKLFDMNYGIF